MTTISAHGTPRRRSPAQPAVAAVVVVLSIAYALVLSAGLLTLPSPNDPIQDPWFTAMELLILVIAPAEVGLMVVVHARAAQERRPWGLAAVVFMAMAALLTCMVHFAVLVLSRQPPFAAAAWAEAVFAFRWPSVVYALDILAWDVFFALAALCAAAALPDDGLEHRARGLMVLAALLALAGLAGVPLADMRVRNVGIVGYAVVFPIAAALLAAAFRPARGGEAAPVAAGERGLAGRRHGR